MARQKKPVHRVQMTEGKRNIIHQLLEEEMSGSDRASSKGYIVRWVEAPSNKLLTTVFEASLESATVTYRLSVDSKIPGIAIEHRNPKVPESRDHIGV